MLKNKQFLFYYCLILCLSYSCKEKIISQKLVTNYFEVKSLNDSLTTLVCANCPALNFSTMDYLLSSKNINNRIIYRDNFITMTEPSVYILPHSPCDTLPDSTKIAMIKELIFIHLKIDDLCYYKNPFDRETNIYTTVSQKAMAIKYIDYIYWGQNIPTYTDIYPSDSKVIFSQDLVQKYEEFYAQLDSLGSLARAKNLKIYPPK